MSLHHITHYPGPQVLPTVQPGVGVTPPGMGSQGGAGPENPTHPLVATPYPMPPPPPPRQPLLAALHKKAWRGLRAVPKVPGLLVLALCSVSFFFGRFVQQAALLPEPAVLGQTSNPDEALKAAGLPTGNGRQLKAVTLNSIQHINSSAGAGRSSVAGLDPFNTDAFEDWVATQLAAKKPLMTPGESGEHFYRTISFQILSWYPRIMVFPNFIDRERANHIIDKATKQMHPSDLAYRPGEKFDPAQQVRTSTGTFVTSYNDPILDWLEKKVAAISFLPQNNGEAWNVLNYKYSQHYDSHFDTFDPKEYGPQPSQRIATVIVLLSDVDGGGQTVFKREGKGNEDKPISNWTSCEVDGGLAYKPRFGDAVLFWDIRPNGDIDPHALHGSCPITSGNKWIAVKWIRSRGEY